MKITFLGTGNAQATACYNTCFVMEEAGRCLLVDGGGGNLLLRRLQDAGYKWQDMRDIIVTHKHIEDVYKRQSRPGRQGHSGHRRLLVSRDRLDRGRL